ncbi:pilin assembly protein [Parathalassolituus penaei]|uniref:Pilin assembly protein n=1 Tax=Parathalassolituus penaei TaxID=2997323 RepID=A0A9X3IT50_9GAMM|nr:pilin assembly protein [Parathalassolituus penaei]MCY0965930.1 pilin assembly protein [Parathalassolituus penaei]
MKASKLLEHWGREFGEPLSDTTYQLPLNVKDAAQIEALLEMFPGLTAEQILRDLVSAALHDLAGSLPYVAGNKVVARDEEGFPVYEDVGPTPQFLALTRKHLGELNRNHH